MARPSTRFKYKDKRKPIFKMPKDAPQVDQAIRCQTCGEITQKRNVYPENRNKFYVSFVCPNGHQTNRTFTRFAPKIN